MLFQYKVQTSTSDSDYTSGFSEFSNGERHALVRQSHKKGLASSYYVVELHCSYAFLLGKAYKRIDILCAFSGM